MEIYLLITGVVTLIGVIFIVVYLEKASRANAERFKKEREDVQLQLQSLAAIHSLIESTQGQTNAILTALHSVQEQSVSLLNAQDANSQKRAESALSAQSQKFQELKDKADEISTRLNTINASLLRGLDALAKAETENAKELRQVVSDSARQVQALKQSLEESIKF